jgi:hypothetical protein
MVILAIGNPECHSAQVEAIIRRGYMKMKRITFAGIVASLLTASGAALAAEPFVLADTQLDRVTAGADTPRVGLANIVEQGNVAATIDGVIEPLTVI